jgi:hypothetical protein
MRACEQGSKLVLVALAASVHTCVATQLMQAQVSRAGVHGHMHKNGCRQITEPQVLSFYLYISYLSAMLAVVLLGCCRLCGCLLLQVKEASEVRIKVIGMRIDHNDMVSRAAAGSSRTVNQPKTCCFTFCCVCLCHCLRVLLFRRRDGSCRKCYSDVAIACCSLESSLCSTHLAGTF